MKDDLLFSGLAIFIINYWLLIVQEKHYDLRQSSITNN